MLHPTKNTQLQKENCAKHSFEEALYYSTEQLSYSLNESTRQKRFKMYHNVQYRLQE